MSVHLYVVVYHSKSLLFRVSGICYPGHHRCLLHGKFSGRQKSAQAWNIKKVGCDGFPQCPQRCKVKPKYSVSSYFAFERKLIT